MPELLTYTLPEHLAARRAARRREWTVQLVAGCVVIVSFLGAGWLLTPMNAIRKERQWVIDPESVQGLPPDIALLGKLGTFRALAIDWAAIRAERLKEEGKTYEALQLYETLCALAPRFPSVWVNAAWNMAYNISVMKYSPEQRWKWVRNGLAILRDRGIQYNPKSVTLYKELAYIYWHKIGDFLDDHHLNYKRALAVEMERVLGPPPLALVDQEYFDWFQKNVDAPRDLSAFIAEDADVSRLLAELSIVGLEADTLLLDFVARHLRTELRVSDLLQEQEQDTLRARRLAILTDEERKEAVDRLLAAVRSKVLREKFRFDLDWMWDLMINQYGPLDWRHAASHTLYWSSLGDRITRDHENQSIHDLLNNARFIFYALQQIIMKGRITLTPDFDDPFSSYIELTPDPRYIPYLYETYLRLGKEHFGDHPEFKEGTPGPRYLNGFVSAMHNWIHVLYLEGGKKNTEMAENFFAWLRKNNPHPDGTTQERYLQTLDEFVMGEMLDQLQTYKAANAFIRSLIQRGLKQFALELSQSAVTSLQRARQSYKVWMIDTDVDPTDRRKMQPFAIIVRDEIGAFLTRPDVAPLYKARLWKHLPLALRQSVYDRAAPYFERLCAAQTPPWDVAKGFAEPPGMDSHRQKEIDYRGKARREGIEEGTHDNS